MSPHPKIRAPHLARQAYLSVRQSTLRHVLHATESQERHYHLAQRACEFGWLPTPVVTIDDDQAQTGSRAPARPGFQQLLGAIAADQVGSVLVLEVSRLARHCSAWDRV